MEYNDFKDYLGTLKEQNEKRHYSITKKGNHLANYRH